MDLAALSIVEIAHQFEGDVAGAITRGDVALGRMGDWLVTAAHLALLRSRLLLPADSREGQEARREAEALRRQLADRAAVAALADWLPRRQQLGHEVFPRGAPEPSGKEAGEGGGGRRSPTSPPSSASASNS